MTIEYFKDVVRVPAMAEVDGDGEITIHSHPDERYDMPVIFDIEEFEEILRVAKQHHTAYVKYREADFDDAVYKQALRDFDNESNN